MIVFRAAVIPLECEVITANRPGLDLLKTYHTAGLAKDVLAGLVLSALLLPQGMAYAELATSPAVAGLYTSILCLVGTPSSAHPRSWC